MTSKTIAGKPRKRGGTQPKRPRGRPSKFRPEFCQRATDACLLGATNADLGQIFDVDERTIVAWIASKPEFAAAVKAGRKDADAKVARALYLKATGQWTQPAVKIVADAKTGQEHIVHYIEHFPPDTVAAIFWLKNRAGWRDRQEIDAKHDVRGEHKVSMELSEEARRWINEDLAEMGMPLIEPPAKGNGARKPGNGSTKH